MNASTGEISFKAAPDFEAPLDSNLDNTYVLTLTAKDALNAARNKAITITVTDAPEVPALSGLRPFVLATGGRAAGAAGHAMWCSSRARR